MAAFGLAAGCVEQEPGLVVIVRVDPEPVATLALPEGSLAVERAVLFLGRVELVPCDTALAGSWFGWLVGAAHAHGEGEAGALSVAVDAVDARVDEARELARIAVSPGLSICALHLGVGEGTGIGLVGRVDGAARDWLGEFESAPRLPVPPLTLDADRREVTVTLRFALGDWAADVPAGSEAAQARALAANAAAAITAQVEPEAR